MQQISRVAAAPGIGGRNKPPSATDPHDTHEKLHSHRTENEKKDQSQTATIQVYWRRPSAWALSPATRSGAQAEHPLHLVE